MIQKLIAFFSKNQKYFTIGGACLLLVLNGEQRTRIFKLQQEVKLAKELQSTTAIDSLVNVNDSLQLELFNAQNQNGRYELSLENLNETNPKAAKEFEEYMNHNTE